MNLRYAWQFCLSSIGEELKFYFICKINSFVSRNESLDWGFLRSGKLGITGSNYISTIPNKNEVIDSIQTILKDSNVTAKALDLIFY